MTKDDISAAAAPPAYFAERIRADLAHLVKRDPAHSGRRALESRPIYGRHSYPKGPPTGHGAARRGRAPDVVELLQGLDLCRSR